MRANAIRIILKGLIDKRKIKTNSFIILILFVAYTIGFLLLGYQDKLLLKEYEKEEYRTLDFISSVDDSSYLLNYDIEVADLIGENKYHIIFNTKEEKDLFLNECEYIKSVSVNLLMVENTQEGTIVIKIVFYGIAIILITLIYIFTLGHLTSLKKDLALYKILGFEKYKILFLLYIFYSMVYSLLYIIAYNGTYFIYYLLCKFNKIDVYYQIYNLDWKFFLIILLILILSFVANNKQNRGRLSDIDIIKIN